jgi:peptide/nickel transport system substrate-binding protein
VKKKILLLAVSLLMLAVLVPSSLLVSSCKTTTSTTTTSTTAANTPQYGGTLTVWTDWGMENPGGFDPSLTPRPWSTCVWDSPFLLWIILGDVEQYGPRGSNKFAFQTTESVPDQYLGGNSSTINQDQIATGWEITASPVQVTLHLRHGIMWEAQPTIGMASRELTSDDVVFSLERSLGNPVVGGFYNWVQNITNPDPYTVVFNMSSFNANWAYFLAWGGMPGQINSTESGNTTVGGGSEDWKNASCDGPFKISDYVSGSAVTYVKNTNYKGTTTINGTKYTMPFIDKLVYPIIVDKSTLLADLQTGKIDWWTNVPAENASILNQSAPALIQASYPSNTIWSFKENRLDNQYLKIKAVRQALFKATDLATIRDVIYKSGEIYSWPIPKGDPGYIQMSDLPASTQDLFAFDSGKAQQMLQAAGYPQGFSLTVLVSSADTTQQDIASLVVSMWAKVNVKLNIKLVDPTAKAGLESTRSYDITMFNQSISNTLVPMGYSAPGLNSLFTADEPFFTLTKQISETIDPVQRTTLEDQLALNLLDDAYYLQFANPVILNCYWPWMKNYYGEIDAGYHNTVPMTERMWIDSSLRNTIIH